MGLLQLLKALFGKGYLNKIMGTRTNVVKPIKMDKSSPFKRYSDSAYDDPEVVEIIEKKIDEYGPYALNNKNSQELANFEDNAKRLLAAKNKQTGTTPGMVKSMEPKPEAEMFGFETKQKLDDQGIMTLKEDLGLPEGVTPKSKTGKTLQELKKTTKELELKGKQFEGDMETSFQDAAEGIFRTGKGASKDVMREGQRRAVIREILLRDDNLRLPAKEFDDLLYSRDLGRNTDAEDPFKLLEKYYEDGYVLSKLDSLDDIIDSTGSAIEAADTFLKKGGFKLRSKDLGDKLKDYKGDPDGLAEGGRIGFAGGGIKFLLNLINKRAGKDVLKTADKIDRPESALNRDMFGAFEDRMNRQTLDVPEVPSGFKLSKEKLLKNFPEIDESFADEIMAMDRDMQTRIIEMLKDRRKNPKAYDKLLSEKGDTLDFQGEFDRSVQRNKNAGGGRIGMLVGGSVLKLMLQNLAKERGDKPSSILQLMNIKSLPKEIRDRLSPKEIKEFLDKRLEQVKNFKDMMETKLNFNQAIDKGKELNEGLTSDIFEYFDDTFSKGNPVPRSVDEKSVLEMEQMIKNMEMKDRKLNASGGLNYLMGF